MSDEQVKTLDEEQTKQIIALLQEVVRNDETRFSHHQPRRFDGKDPKAAGGTIWLTPREMARRALRKLGARVPDALQESLANE